MTYEQTFNLALLTGGIATVSTLFGIVVTAVLNHVLASRSRKTEVRSKALSLMGQQLAIKHLSGAFNESENERNWNDELRDALKMTEVGDTEETASFMLGYVEVMSGQFNELFEQEKDLMREQDELMRKVAEQKERIAELQAKVDNSEEE